MSEELILKALTEELKDHLFDATYGDPHTGGPQIRVKCNEMQRYFVLIEDNQFIIRRSNDIAESPYRTHPDGDVVREIPLEHPNSILAVMRYLDRKCEFGKTRRRNSFTI